MIISDKLWFNQNDSEIRLKYSLGRIFIDELSKNIIFETIIFVKFDIQVVEFNKKMSQNLSKQMKLLRVAHNFCILRNGWLKYEQIGAIMDNRWACSSGNVYYHMRKMYLYIWNNYIR